MGTLTMPEEPDLADARTLDRREVEEVQVVEAFFEIEPKEGREVGRSLPQERNRPTVSAWPLPMSCHLLQFHACAAFTTIHAILANPSSITTSCGVVRPRCDHRTANG